MGTTTEEIQTTHPLPTTGANAYNMPRWLTWLRIALNETHKGLMLQWSYRFDLVTQMIMLSFIFLGIVFFMGGGEIEPRVMASSLLGYVLWFYATAAINEMSWSLREEAQVGTLEQMYMSTAPAGVVRIGRTLATLTFSTIIIAVMTTTLTLIFKIDLPFRWASLLVFLLTLIGVYGFGFIVGGMTLIFKQTNSLANMIQNALLFLNGAFLPIDQMPDWLANVARTLPTTQGIIVLRRVTLEDHSLAAVWTDGSLVWLIIHTGIYFSLGWFVFNLCERIAKKRGQLGQY